MLKSPRTKAPLSGALSSSPPVSDADALIRASTAKSLGTVRLALGGNLAIFIAKVWAWQASGSSAMASEAIHSAVDFLNQALLLVGMREGMGAADKRHPYGYGKSIYFWALVSALGTFWLGAGVGLGQSVQELMNPSFQAVTWEVWAVLGFSLLVDGAVLGKVLLDFRRTAPDLSLLQHVRRIRDPATLAILYEDAAAVAGVVLASAGIMATYATGSPVYDGTAGVAISGLLAFVGLQLVLLNQRFLLGQAVDADITEGIESILLQRRSIEGVSSVQSQWTGPYAFSYKAEVDFDGTYLAARLMSRYKKEFRKATEGSSLDKDLSVLLSWYAEDVMRLVEREVRDIEAEIRSVYPGAAYIELEPDSKYSDQFAIDDVKQEALQKIEMDALEKMMVSLKNERGRSDPKSKNSPKTNRTKMKGEEETVFLTHEEILRRKD